jgi:hypothetical protein
MEKPCMYASFYVLHRPVQQIVGVWHHAYEKRTLSSKFNFDEYLSSVTALYRSLTSMNISEKLEAILLLLLRK